MALLKEIEFAYYSRRH